MAFYWECETFRLAMAPWQSDPRLQQTVCARVAVAEQRAPGFALRFDLELLGAEMQIDSSVLTPCTHLMRLVNQRQMLQTFEFAFVGAEAKNRRPPGGEEEGRDELLDMQLKKWLAGGGQVPPPPKDELAKWLLCWMVVTPAIESDKQSDEWIVLMCGEKGAEVAVEDGDDLVFYESGDANEPVADGKDNDENDDEYVDDGSEEQTDEDDDLPPPYEEVEVAESENSEVEIDIGDCRKEKQRQSGRTAGQLSETSRASSSNRSFQSRDQAAKALSKRSSSTRSLANTCTMASSKQTLELKPTIVRLNPRLDSLDVAQFEESTKGWSKDRRQYQQELRTSRRDVQTATQQRDKLEKLAQLRHTQLLKETARKLRLNEEKRRDAQAVRQMISDTLEYRDELCAMETRVKQASIAARRDQERVKRQMRVVLGNTEKSSHGTIKLGSGPLSKQEMELLFGDTRNESAVYDLHGRRHHLEKAGLVAKESALESAIHKVRRVVLNSGKNVEIFRRYDLDRSGTLNYNELQRMLRENETGHSAELTLEQSTAFFKRFDADDSGEVDYGEILWGFLNVEAFLKRWHERKNASTGLEVRRSFKKFDPTGRGFLPLKEFQLVLDHLGITLGDIDAKLLAFKFDAGKDGYIDYQKFLEYVNLPDSQDESSSTSAKYTCQSTAQTDLNSSSAPPGMERIWMELQEVSTAQARFHRLLQK